MLLRVLFFLLNCVFFYLPVGNENLKFFMLNILLTTYVVMELIHAYRKDSRLFFIRPIFISMVIIYGLIYGGLVNYLLIYDGEYIIKGFGYKVFFEREWLTKTMFVVNISALAAWIGYDLRLGTRMYNGIMSIPLYRKIYNSEIDTNRLLFFAVIAYLAKFYLFTIGLYGRIVDEKFFEAGTGFKAGSQIRILSELSYVTFLFICIYKFREPTAKKNAIFFTCFALEIFFGFIYGARGPFITPFLIMLFANYYVKKKIKIINVSLLLIVIYAAFTIVYQFKGFVLSSGFSRTASATELIQNFSARQNQFEKRDASTYEVSTALDATLNSTTFVPETAVAIRQADMFGLDGLGNPNIVKTILAFPVDAVVPRFIQGQNEFSWGYWFKEEVIEINRGLKYSIAMSPIGFLYMGGGIWLVIAGFLFYGILLRMTSHFLVNNNLFSVLVYLMVGSALVNLDSIYSNALIYATRYLFIFPVIFWVLFDPRALRKI